MDEDGLFDYEKERPFYCERAQCHCPFDSQFRYCSCCELLVKYSPNQEVPGDE